MTTTHIAYRYTDAGIDYRRFASEADARRYATRMADTVSQLWGIAAVVNGRAVRI